MFYLCISLHLRFRTCLVHLGKNIREEEVREIKKDVLAGSYVFSPLKLVVLPNKITPF